ncbi:MAG: DUF4375 domain-containing protein [Terricaulis sp.]|jgi:hypothetical protein
MSAGRQHPVQVEVDAAVIAAGDPEVADPIWWTASFYEDLERYEESLRGFTKPQRLVWAVLWYCSEIHNGGHDQFFSNSTGMIWPDALEGLGRISRPDLQGILREAIQRFPTPPSRERDEREDQMAEHDVRFDGLDEELWGAGRAHSLSDSLIAYIRSQPEAFYFSGVVRRAPRRGTIEQ